MLRIGEKMKKFIVPVTWMVGASVEVEAIDEDGAAHEAMGVDIDSIPDPEYVRFSYEVDAQAIEEVSTEKSEIGDFSAWNDMPGGF
tara:strand:+ start:805 stop:1062 length:258 start_codon:yes stop_codon:yes gene_type:complete